MFDPTGSVCVQCAKRRCERKEIITEIIDTEIKYGRDLRIIQEEFYRPMQVAGLLTSETLSGIFLNVEELAEVNKSFTESLKDAIEIALDEGDEDLCTVNIGKIFLEAEPMLGAFKSYCTRQVRYEKICRQGIFIILCDIIHFTHIPFYLISRALHRVN